MVILALSVGKIDTSSSTFYPSFVASIIEALGAT